MWQINTALLDSIDNKLIWFCDICRQVCKNMARWRQVGQTDLTSMSFAQRVFLKSCSWVSKLGGKWNQNQSEKASKKHSKKELTRAEAGNLLGDALQSWRLLGTQDLPKSSPKPSKRSPHDRKKRTMRRKIETIAPKHITETFRGTPWDRSDFGTNFGRLKQKPGRFHTRFKIIFWIDVNSNTRRPINEIFHLFDG